MSVFINKGKTDLYLKLCFSTVCLAGHRGHILKGFVIVSSIAKGS